MKTYSVATLAALSSGSLALVQLVHMAFPGGVIAINTSNWTLSWESVSYTGAYGLGTVSPIVDKPGEVQGITLTLNGGDPLKIALALDSADEVQGTVVTIRTALIETTGYTILDAPIEWVGKCDTMSIGEDGETAEISVTVESGAVDLMRGNARTYSDASLQDDYPGDLAFTYVVSQIDKPIIWPSRGYFLK